MELTSLPEWIRPALLGGILAVMGYVGKGVAESLGRFRASKRRRRARLAELLARIRAGDVAWQVQCENRDKLEVLIGVRDPVLAAAKHGYDRLFALAFPSMPAPERELHEVIRAYTIHTLRPLNESLLAWLAADTDFRIRPPGPSRRAKLGEYLANLEAHLLLWQGKYAAWIPEHPERALVYLDDEARHGTPFPAGGAKIVADVLHRWWVGG